MSKRFDVCTPRPKKDGSTFWHRIGTAFEGEKGTTLYLDSLPLQDAEGRCVMMLFEPREHRAKDIEAGGVTKSIDSSFEKEIDDEIQF